jgi:4-hydroxy-tetrahydrodipicolinate reductase
MSVRIAIAGAAGRMGRALIREVAARDGAALAGGVERAGHADLGADLGALAGIAATGLMLGDDAAKVFAKADVVIDFTGPGAAGAHAALAAKHGAALVSGATGLDAEEEAAIEQAAGAVPVLRSGNMSLGVTLLSAMVRDAAARLGPDWDIEIVEMHHRMKADAPSGTALMLGRAAAEGRGGDLESLAERGRDGLTGPRREGGIGFAALRGGTVAGEHSVIFAGAGERVEFTHRAEDRAIFARGAVTAALWLKTRAPGLYTMADVLGV